MYLKITGIVLIMMSASLMGYLFSKDYIERINRLEQIQKMLILLIAAHDVREADICAHCF